MTILVEHPSGSVVVEADCTPFAIPAPLAGERPTVYADRVGEWYAAKQSDQHRKIYGLFLTPVPVADFMARRIKVSGRKLRILDPAAGAGVLCCAAVEGIVSRCPRTEVFELVVHEVDENLIVPLRAVLDHLVDWCRDLGVVLAVRIEATDFVMTNAEVLHREVFPSRPVTEDFDVVIANPPYFKINKADPRAAAVSEVVHGQPNIYALFMAVGAALLRPGGNFIFITPRSFSSGPYFRRFRAVFFGMIRPVGIHVFGSRRDAFRRDVVLQENVIVFGVRENCWHKNSIVAPIMISSSQGVSDIDSLKPRKVSMSVAFDFESSDKILRLPVCNDDEDALDLVDSWSGNLQNFGLNISTGPVVPFRATQFIAGKGKVPTIHMPLLWMNHVHAMRVTWPLDRHKPEYIVRTGPEALLVPNRNYVLLRRFSAKEEARRLIAAPWIAANFSTIPNVGLENHLNYIHRPDGTLSEEEAWGLSALFNSRLLDTWFRAVNGNTQVSATELRAMKLPAHKIIIELGRQVKRLSNPMIELDALVANLVIPPTLEEAAIG